MVSSKDAQIDSEVSTGCKDTVRGITSVIEAIGAEAKGVLTATGKGAKVATESAASTRGQASFRKARIEANGQQKPNGKSENRMLSVVLM
jgi:hypothetical protein